MSRLRSEQMAEAFRSCYVQGMIDVDEMECGIERALRCECTDAEYVSMAMGALAPSWLASRVAERRLPQGD